MRKLKWFNRTEKQNSCANALVKTGVDMLHDKIFREDISHFIKE